MYKIDHYLTTKQSQFILETMIEALEVLESSEKAFILEQVRSDPQAFKKVMDYVCDYNASKTKLRKSFLERS